MKNTRLSLLICIVLLLIIFALSLTLRITLPWNEVFGGSMVKLTDNDAYFYARLLDNLSAHFPSMPVVDPYYVYPEGKDLSGQPMFSVYFMGFWAWLAGGGSPDPNTVDLAAVYIPAILGALLVFPVFFITAAAVNRWAGLAAALLITLMPGEFLARTLLGNPDSHVVEIFLSTLFMLFLLLGITGAKQLKLSPFKDIDRRKASFTGLYLLLAGLFLGAYVAAWAGAALFVLISFVYLAIQFMSDHLRQTDTRYLLLSGSSIYILALVITCSAANILTVTRAVLLTALILTVVLYVMSLFFHKYRIKSIYYLPALAIIALLSIGVLVAIDSMTGSMMLYRSTAFLIWDPNSPVAETKPFLVYNGIFTLAPIWGNYTFDSVLALSGIIICIYKAFKEGKNGMLMLSVWSVIILIATLAMRRFAYYLAINVAILSGLSCWLILQSCGWKATQAKTAPTVKAAKLKTRSKHTKTRLQGAGNRGLMAAGIIAVLVLTVYPNTGPLPGGDRPFYDVATKGLFTPSDAWCDSLKWLRNNSQEPFGDSSYYYENYHGTTQAAGYSVLTWWDYGYWVTRIAHRVPVCNPGDQLKGEEKYFTLQKSSDAAELSNNWKLKYVVIDDYMINWRSGFAAMASAAGHPASNYYEIYYRQQNESLTQALLYYPEYYQTMAVRLYCFDGRPFTPQETAVISWEQRNGTDGRPYKLITGLKTFGSYAIAADFVAGQKSGNWRIVGKDPRLSPVPLDEVTGYSLAYSSTQSSATGTGTIPSVKIFEYNANINNHEQ